MQNNILMEILELTSKKLNPSHKKFHKPIKSLKWLDGVDWKKLSPSGRYLRGFEVGAELEELNIIKWDNIESVEGWSMSVPTSLSRIQSMILLNEKNIAVAHDSRITVFDIFSMARVITLSHKSSVRSMAHIGSHGLASGGDDGFVKIWDMNDENKEPVGLFHGGPVYAVVYLGGSRLASGGLDGFVKVWNLENIDSEPLAFSHGSWVNSIA